jgi:hypothetical protein
MEMEMAGSLWSEMTGAAPPRDLLVAALAEQPGPFQRYAIWRWFDWHAPWADRQAVEEVFTAGTVNDPHRRDFARTEDLLYRRPDGQYERYEREVHGRWSSSGDPIGAPTLPLRPVA